MPAAKTAVRADPSRSTCKLSLVCATADASQPAFERELFGTPLADPQPARMYSQLERPAS